MSNNEWDKVDDIHLVTALQYQIIKERLDEVHNRLDGILEKLGEPTSNGNVS